MTKEKRREVEEFSRHGGRKLGKGRREERRNAKGKEERKGDRASR